MLLAYIGRAAILVVGSLLKEPIGVADVSVLKVLRKTEGQSLLCACVEYAEVHFSHVESISA